MKYNIRLDVCTLCKLNCPTCTMRLLNYGGNGAGYLTFENYKKFLNNNENQIKRIEISNAGEPFLNPEIIDILKYSKEKNIDITCNNGTTLNFNNKKILEALVDYEVKSVVVAIDGITQECYEKYRRNGNLNLVLENLKYLLDYKKQKNSTLPEVKWQYVIMENTEDKEQIIGAKEMAKSLGIEICFKLTWDRSYIPKNEVELKELTNLNYLTQTQYEKSTGKLYRRDDKFNNKCGQLWSFPQINWDGKVMGCCANRIPFNINVFDLGENSIQKLFNNEEFKSAKDWLCNKNTDIITPCHSCQNSFKIRENGGMDTEFISKWNKLYNL